MVESVLAFPDIQTLETAITDYMRWTTAELNSLLFFAEDEEKNQLIVKEKEWLSPTQGGVKLKTFMTEQCGATCDSRLGRRKYFIERRMAEIPISEEHVVSTPEESQPAKTVTVKLSQLQYGVFSPRKTSKRWIEHLKEAIQSEGTESFPPPKARPHPNGKMAEQRFQLVDGEHFCHALDELGVKNVKIEVHNLSDEEADVKAMRFNQIHGKPLEPIEEASHLKKMMDKYDLSQEQVAKKFSRNQPWVSRRLAMLEVGKNNVIQRGITSTHAQEIVKVPEETRQEIVDKIEREELSTRPTSELVHDITETPEKTTEVLKAPYDPLGVECSLCGMGTHFPLARGGKKVCSKCTDKIDKDPGLLKELSQPSHPKQKTEKKLYKPKDTWEYRDARMKVSPSKMDEAVFTLAQQNQELKDLGYEVIFQKPYVLTVSDLTLKRGDEEKAFFNDHEKTHKNKRDADREKREILMKFRPNVQAIGIDYGANTKPMDILKQILETIK